MKRNILEKYVYYYENVIENPKRLIEQIEDIDHLLSDETGVSKWIDWKASNSGYAFGKQKRIRENLLNKNHPVYNECRAIKKEITDSIISVSKDYESMHTGLDIGMLCPLSISKYFVGSEMGKHTDTNDNNDEEKTISVVLYLNDDYTGGEIELPDQSIIIKPTQGSIVVFPSRKPYFHQSNLITLGEKYIVPGFWENKVKIQTGWING